MIKEPHLPRLLPKASRSVHWVGWSRAESRPRRPGRLLGQHKVLCGRPRPLMGREVEDAGGEHAALRMPQRSH